MKIAVAKVICSTSSRLMSSDIPMYNIGKQRVANHFDEPIHEVNTACVRSHRIQL